MKQTIKKITYLFIAASVLIAPSAMALSVDPNFDAGLLIPDQAFSDTLTFGGPEGIQQFLESKNSILARTDQEFLVKLREPADQSLKTALEDPQPSLQRLRTAAELIHDAASSNGLNAQVILVTLQKEQSLITGTFSTNDKLQRALDRALGYGCFEGTTCQANFLGFYYQLFGNLDNNQDRWIGAAKSLMRSFNYAPNGTRTGRGPRVDASNQAFGVGPFVKQSVKGDTIIVSNELGGFDNVSSQQTITLKNYATAALYRYTPHAFNGNYNFWRFYRMWFKYPNGTILKSSTDSTLWIIDNGLRKQFTNFVAEQRGLDTSKAIVVSPTELNGYDIGPRLLPKEGTLLKSSDSPDIYIVEGGKLRKVTPFTAQQHGIDLTPTITIPQTELNSYEKGTVLLPKEGTLIKSNSSPAIYVIIDSEKRPITFPIFQMHKYSFAKVVSLPNNEVVEIPTGKLMPPVDGTLVKSQNQAAVYLVEQGTKRIISGQVFALQGYSFKNIYTLSEEEMNALTPGLAVFPPDNTLIKKANDPTLYLSWQKAKTPITYTIFVQRNLGSKKVYALSDAEIDAMPTDDFTLSPEEGSVVKASSAPQVYLVKDGVLHMLSYEAFVNRGLSFGQVLSIPEGEFRLLEQGEAIIK